MTGSEERDEATGATVTAADVEETWAHLDAEAGEAGLHHHALIRFERYYLSLEPVDRDVADAVLAEWVGLELGSRRRFDALAMVRRFRVESALDALRAEWDRLGERAGETIPYERARLAAIIERIEADGS